MDCRNFIVSKIETVRVCISGQNLLLDSPELDQLTEAPTKKNPYPQFPKFSKSPGLEEFFFLEWSPEGRESPPECIDIEVGPKPIHQWLQRLWQTTDYNSMPEA